MFTLDTNFIIRFLSGDENCVLFAEQNLLSAQIIVPTLVRSELLSKSDLSIEEYTSIIAYLNETEQISLNIPIADITSDIRRQYKIKTPDAIIAATAIATHSILVTANVGDFKKIKELKLKKI